MRYTLPTLLPPFTVLVLRPLGRSNISAWCSTSQAIRASYPAIASDLKAPGTTMKMGYYRAERQFEIGVGMRNSTQPALGGLLVDGRGRLA
ncbi:hypothetical protein [Aquitalea denitrificans]|uniref:hypothetical protein n=1 Tax=Aquitalea denitrificans TaxID=519081 RepID=UPI00135900CE|nr:hypothetical protein [Aquitalea denitrificans]